jgi:hypothetical protein
VPLSIIPRTGSTTIASVKGKNMTAMISAAVPPSVASTVPVTPMRAPSQPHENLPAAPPMKTKTSAVPIIGVEAPFALRRKGRKVRRPIRTAVSRTPIANSTLKPNAAACLSDARRVGASASRFLACRRCRSTQLED